MTDKSEGRDAELAGAEVYTIYLYYLDFSGGIANPTIKSYVHFDENRAADLQRDVPDLVEAAIEDQNPVDTSFDDFNRERKGYVVIALDHATFERGNPVTFTCDRARIPSSRGNSGQHTFLPRNQFSVPYDSRSISIAPYLYPAKSYDHGDDLKDNEWEHYKIALRGNMPDKIVDILYDDSGGTNMGPPPRPPGFTEPGPA